MSGLLRKATPPALLRSINSCGVCFCPTVRCMAFDGALRNWVREKCMGMGLVGLLDGKAADAAA